MSSDDGNVNPARSTSAPTGIPLEESQATSLDDTQGTDWPERAHYAMDTTAFSIYHGIERRMIQKFVDSLKVFAICGTLMWGSVFSGIDVAAHVFETLAHVWHKTYRINIEFLQRFMCEKDKAKSLSGIQTRNPTCLASSRPTLPKTSLTI